MPDPTKPKKKKSGKKSHKLKTKDGSEVAVGEKSVKNARKREGVFKKRPAYKGKKYYHKDKKTLRGIKTNDGKYTPVNTDSERKKAEKTYSRDKAIHRRDSINHEDRVRRFKRAKRKPSVSST